MADRKISQLSAGGALQATDLVEVARSGDNYSILGSEFASLDPPVELVGTDPAEAVLTLRADDAQTEHVFRLYDVNGDLAVDIDFQGILDVRSLNIQVPPDVGGGPGSSGSNMQPDQWSIASGSDTTDDPLFIRKWDGVGAYRERMKVSYYDNQILTFLPIESEVAVLIPAPATPTGNAIEVWDFPFNNLLFAVGYDGGITVSLPTSNPGPNKLWNDGGTVKVGT